VAISKNKELREQIDSLRRERVIFDNIYKKLEKELHKKREEMANIIEVANTAYEQRDLAQEKLATIMQQADWDKIEYDKEMGQVTNLLEKNRQMEQFQQTQE